ncbi:MAG: hypothetical protein JST53_07450 [Actinobacteria bacterium]|nr:hypothetical protein [Actinomycetota bacterium]
MNLPTTLRWIALALLGLIIAAAVALGASRLASQQIGIASESVSAGDTLAPPITSATRRRQEKSEVNGPGKEGTRTEAQPPFTEQVEPEAEPTGPSSSEPSSGDDESGGGGGDGGGPDD